MGTAGHGRRFDFALDPGIESEARAALRCQKVESPDLLSPRIFSVASAQTGREGEAGLGDLIRVRGSRMKFDPTNSGQGLFFLSADGCERRASIYAHIQPSIVIAALPADLVAGQYILDVRTVSRGGAALKSPSRTAMRVVARSEEA
jgi:hypothetical protein